MTPGLDQEVASCGALFADPAWQDAWSSATVERIDAEQRLTAPDRTGGEIAVPLYRTADSALWRGYEDDAGCSDLLPSPVCYLSSLYAISNPVNRVDPARLAGLLDRAKEVAAGGQATVLVVPNLEDAVTLSELRHRHPPAAEVRLDATCRTSLPASVEEFVERLGKSARSDFRRRHRRAVESGVSFVVYPADVAAGRLPEFLALTEQAAREHGNAPLYDLATLTAMAAVPGAVLLTAQHDGELLAGSLSFVHGDCLVVWAAGIDYARLKDFHSYVFLLRETLEFAIGHDCRWMDFGRGTFEFKRRHGFGLTTLYTLCYDLGVDRTGWIDDLAKMDEAIQPLLGGG